MNTCQKFLSVSLLALFASAAFAADAPPLDTAGDFAVLSAAPGVGGAVTTTGSSITGNVGSSGAVSLTDTTITGNLNHGGAFTNVSSTISGTITPSLIAQVVTDFDEAYAALDQVCDQTILTAAFTGLPLTVNSGVICFPAAVTFTNSVLTLTGNGPWIFRVGSQDPTGALTGKNLTVAMARGGDACDVFWQVSAAATLTTSVFQGNILAGAAITTTGGIVAGRLLSKAAVTMTNTIVSGCDALPGAPSCTITPPKPPRQRCDQGVGNGPEGCDPGNSNQGDPLRSNDELGGTPGNPGRKGGNNK